MVYPMNVAGLRRELPLCKVTDTTKKRVGNTWSSAASQSYFICSIFIN